MKKTIPVTSRVLLLEFLLNLRDKQKWIKVRLWLSNRALEIDLIGEKPNPSSSHYVATGTAGVYPAVSKAIHDKFSKPTKVSWFLPKIPIIVKQIRDTYYPGD